MNRFRLAPLASSFALALLSSACPSEEAAPVATTPPPAPAPAAETAPVAEPAPTAPKAEVARPGEVDKAAFEKKLGEDLQQQPTQ